MKLVRSLLASIAAASLLALAPAPAPAAGPDLLGSAFEVKASGSAVEVTFALSLSEVSSYPVTITAVRGDTEEVLWDGSLTEGLYKFRGQLSRISGSGPLRVILKTRVVNRSAQGNQTFTSYLKWEGSN